MLIGRSMDLKTETLLVSSSPLTRYNAMQASLANKGYKFRAACFLCFKQKVILTVLEALC